MKNQALLPLVTYPEPSSDSVAAGAVAMAAALGAQLHALAFEVDIPAVSSPLSPMLLNVPEMIRQAESQSRNHGQALLAKVAEEAKRTGLDATTDAITSSAALLAGTAAVEARYYDVTLCGWQAANPTAGTMAEAVIFGSGRPTILLPERGPVRKLDNVAIAWDGSRVAARAVADAHHLLSRASRITVLTVTDEKPLGEQDAAERLAQGLRSRGLTVQAMPFSAEDYPIDVSLQERALEIGADLMVMGAFGHTRVRDFVLGGATRGILTDLRLPILLSH
jgi:nucleotide-binding universal stress UspA family protein